MLSCTKAWAHILGNYDPTKVPPLNKAVAACASPGLFHLWRKRGRLHLAQNTFLSLEQLLNTFTFQPSLPGPALPSHSVVSDRKPFPAFTHPPSSSYTYNKPSNNSALFQDRALLWEVQQDHVRSAGGLRVRQAVRRCLRREVLLVNTNPESEKPIRKLLELNATRWTEWTTARLSRGLTARWSRRESDEDQTLKPCAALPEWDPEPPFFSRRLGTLNLDPKVGKMGFAKIIRNPGALVCLPRSSDSWI